jgi:hypothetical protein
LQVELLPNLELRKVWFSKVIEQARHQESRISSPSIANDMPSSLVREVAREVPLTRPLAVSIPGGRPRSNHREGPS